MRLWQQSMIFLARNEAVKLFMQGRSAVSELAQRYVGGKSAQDVIKKCNALKSKGLSASLYFLGEYVQDLSIIDDTVEQLKTIIRRLAESDLDVHVSIDPTQIGHQVAANICREHAFALAEEIKKSAKSAGPIKRNFLMLDMEDSSVTQATIDLHQRLTAASLPTAITLQAYLYRTESDLANIISSGGAARLVKGAFAENKNIAYTNRKEITGQYLKLADLMLSEQGHDTGFYPIFGTHDDQLIDKIIAMANRRGWRKDQYEFEMLFGVREQFQNHLVRKGEHLRLYLPFGIDWWPYAIRRIGESTNNIKFFLKSLIYP